MKLNDCVKNPLPSRMRERHLAAIANHLIKAKNPITKYHLDLKFQLCACKSILQLQVFMKRSKVFVGM